MRAVVVEQSAWDREFNQTLKDLELEQFRKFPHLAPEERESIREMHRKFVYEIVNLRGRLENSGKTAV